MSEAEQRQTITFFLNYQKLDRGDQRYVQGWVDAKAACQQEKQEAERKASGNAGRRK